MKKLMLKQPVLMATIGAPHGVKGEVRVRPFSEDPLGFSDYGPLVTQDGHSLVVQQARVQKNVVVTRFEGVNTREAAQALNGIELFVDRSVLPDDLEDDEFYLTDLIGMTILTRDGANFGKVQDVPNFGAGDLVEYVPAGKSRTEFLEFSREIFPEIDFGAGQMIVVPPVEVSERDEDDKRDKLAESKTAPPVGGKDEAETGQ